MDQDAHFQTHQKPLTVMNVHNRARKCLNAMEIKRCEMMEFRN